MNPDDARERCPCYNQIDHRHQECPAHVNRMNGRGFGRTNVAITSDVQSYDNKSSWSGSNRSNYQRSTRLPTATLSSTGSRQTSSTTSNARTRLLHRSSNIAKMLAYKRRRPQLQSPVSTPPDAASSPETVPPLLTGHFVPQTSLNLLLFANLV